MTDRNKANLIYFMIGLLVLFFIFNKKLDTPVATNEILNAKVYKSYPYHSKYSLKRIIHIRINSGVEITKVVRANSSLTTGTSLKVRKYKGKISGRTSYKIRY